MTIELRQFESFVVLWEEKNFARAAQRLNVSPPTLTHQIQKLERALGVRLLLRKGNMEIQLTQAGARFLESARDILHQAAEAGQNARKAARGEIGRVNLGYLVSASYHGFVQAVLAEFQREKPGIEISLRVVVSATLVDGMMRREFDAGFISPPNQYPPGLEGHTVISQPLVLALPEQHRLARSRRPVDPAALRDDPFVVATVESELAFWRLTDAVARLGGFVPKVARRAPEMISLLTYVAAGYGVAVVPESMAALKMPNVAYRTFKGADRHKFPTVFVHRSSEPAPATKALIDFMARYKLKA